MFGRAANIIRECGDYDGVAFFYYTSDQTSRKNAQRYRKNPQGMPPSASERSDDSTGSTSGKKSFNLAAESGDTSDEPCPVLAFSVLGQDANVQAQSKNQFPNFMRRDLESAVGKNLRAKIITITQVGDDTTDGASSAGSGAEKMPKAEIPDPIRLIVGSSSMPPLSKQQKPRRSRIAALRKLEPDAQTFHLLPLWDFHRQRWFSCCICWSKSARKDLELNGDLQYLRLFGNNIMMSLSRLDAAFTERSKESFVASISHELRSPLHGILGASEFLSDSSMTRFQQEMVESISSCGRTLLDTLEHVMDFSRINSFSGHGNDKKKQQSLKDSQKNQPLQQEDQTHLIQSPASICDLSILVEEVAEAVWTGSFDLNRPNRLDDMTSSMSHLQVRRYEHANETVVQRGRLKIILRIPYLRSWLVHVQAGALRRIIMNLFANGIKYTNEGLVALKLELRAAELNLMRVRLSVTDTGLGMSDDFQDNYMFRPFSQENPLMPGSGLGLSIVKQITDDLGGQIKFTSNKGSGTQVSVMLALPMATNPSQLSLTQRMAPPMDIYKDIDGLRIRIIREGNSEQSETLSKAENEQAYSLMELAEKWFRADVTLISHCVPDSAEVVILLGPSFECLGKIDAALSDKSTIGVILIASDVMEMGVLRSDRRINDSRLIIETIAQPVGPRKLAQTLKHIVTRRNSPKGSTNRQASFEEVSRLNITKTLAPASASPERPPIIQDPAEQDKSGPMALVVDDNQINLRLLGASMKKIKISYKEATNGQQALDMYKASPHAFTIILMDISMPIMDGVTATREIRSYEQEQALRKIPIVAMTGLASAVARAEAQEAGMNDYFTKPVNFGKVAALMKTYQTKREP